MLCGFLVHCVTKEYAKTSLILIKLEHVPYFDFGSKCAFMLMQLTQKSCWLEHALYSAFWMNFTIKNVLLLNPLCLQIGINGQVCSFGNI